MSAITNQVAPNDFLVRSTGFTVTSGTVAKVLVETQAAAAAASPLPAYYGGCTVIDLVAASTDSANKDIDIFLGEVLTTQDNTNTGVLATTATVNGTVTRVNGSFITDKWKVGDNIMIFTPDGTAQVATTVDGLLSTITAVAATTLTINGTTWSAQTPLTSGTRLVRVSRLFRAQIPLNSGNTNAITNYSLLGSSMDSSVMRFEKKLGSNNMLIGAMVANPSALPAYLSVTATYARY